tara:strand:- start:15 stop:968 length:954 start_codon:yes stop_codon:yes gene_type:complete
MKGRIKNTLFVAIGIFLFVFALRNVELSLLWNELKGAQLVWIIFAVLAGICSHAIRAIRWNQLLEPLGYKVSLLNAFASVMAAYVVNYAIPRSGEVLRCGMVYRANKIPIEKSLGTVFLERVIDLLALLLISLCIILLQFDLVVEFFSANGMKKVPIWIFPMAIIFALAAYFFWSKVVKNWNHPLIQKINRFIQGMMDGIGSISKLKNPVLFVVYSMLIWLGYFLSSYFTLFALAGTAHLGINAALTILFVGTVAVIITPGGTGAFHLMVAKALMLYGISNEAVGMAYSTLNHAIQMIGIFLAGAISYTIFMIKIEK